MKRRWRLAVLVLLALLGLSALAAEAALAEPEEAENGIRAKLIEQQAKQLPTDKVEAYWEKLMNEYGEHLPGKEPPTLMEMIVPGGNGLSAKEVLQGLAHMLLFEIVYNGKLLVTIVILTIFSMLMETLQGAFEKPNVSKIAYAITYIVLMIIAVNSFSVAIGYAKEAIGGMVHFMIAMIPLLLTVLASMGNIVTVSVMHPLIVFMIHTIGTLIYSVVFPLLFFSAVLHIVSSLSDKYKVTQLATLLRNISVGILGVCLTVFLGVVSVQGISAGTTDGVTLRTAKYVTGNFVPVVGRMLSDASDTVIGASLLVKNAIGLFGVIVIVLLCIFPALKILALALIYNLSAAILQPLGDSPIMQGLKTIGQSMIYVFAALASVGLMFFLAITIMIAAGNVTVMMR
ncbi:stage III sporulation protein AE [Xylanibacillus composti]|uniref:Stage III sporulation protein AE n=1 Tax=Xylanibacillus composti TaxID=1572762 RepID=A0A8J4H804_9BACL|nr:stage III sporulation protein AE [Xylanibacillus composti]MDT9726282.1 stage III sporulation protein AE [Xylanibacillus composti]GIQ70689.1 stage III sporulation protein AE [Xylanibacillus composti]